MILTGFRAVLLDFGTTEGNGRSGRDVGKACVREDTGLDCADIASGEDTRGREARGLKGEGAGEAATVMTEATV